MATIQQVDPTQTKELRSDFSAQMYNRWREIKGLVRDSVVKNDVFGLQDGTFNQEALTRRESIKKRRKRELTETEAFMSWLQNQEQNIVIGGASVVAAEWWGRSFISKAYTRGYKKAGSRLRNRASIAVKEVTGTEIATNPTIQNQIDNLAAKGLQDLKNVTSKTNQQIMTVITEGLAENKSSTEIANRINNRVDKIGITRSRKIARTEIVRAHAEATLDRFQQEGVKQVRTKAEFTTAGDSRVCPTCMSLAGSIFTIEEARGLIPVHPLCRCTWLPVREQVQ